MKAGDVIRKVVSCRRYYEMTGGLADLDECDGACSAVCWKNLEGAKRVMVKTVGSYVGESVVVPGTDGRYTPGVSFYGRNPETGKAMFVAFMPVGEPYRETRFDTPAGAERAAEALLVDLAEQ